MPWSVGTVIRDNPCRNRCSIAQGQGHQAFVLQPSICSCRIEKSRPDTPTHVFINTLKSQKPPFAISTEAFGTGGRRTWGQIACRRRFSCDLHRNALCLPTLIASVMQVAFVWSCALGEYCCELRDHGVRVLVDSTSFKREWLVQTRPF